MELTKRSTEKGTDVAVEGRLDSYWADHLTAALEQEVRHGAHEINLDLSRVHYMSSAGIRVLVITHKRLSAIDGHLKITNPSEIVVKVLELSGLSALLLSPAEPDTEAAADTDRKPEGVSTARNGVKYTLYDIATDARLDCTMIGEPGRLDGCRFGSDDVTVMSIPASTTVVGLGAFGSEFHECRHRFGEFLSVAGTAAYLPTDGTGVPDYFVTAEATLPDMSLLYGVAFNGSFAQLVRFEATNDRRAVDLSELIDACLSAAGLDTAGIALVGDSAGLTGAALRNSPATGENANAPYGYPEIRDWLSFTPERVYRQSVAVAVGVVTRSTPGPLAPFVRHLGANGQLAGHVHAAAFTHTPLPRGRIDLRDTVSGIYESELLQNVLHLLRDDRAITGAGESAFSRGACWIGPLDISRSESTR